MESERKQVPLSPNRNMPHIFEGMKHTDPSMMQWEVIMKTIRGFQIALIVITSIFFFSSSWAAGSGRTIVFEPTPEHPGANGTAVIDKNHINLQARGLKPDAVYTVWFVNMKPKKSETGAGSAPYMFRTDQWGNGSYSAPLTETPLGKWATIMVVQHPNGDPKDMKNMIGALMAPL